MVVRAIDDFTGNFTIDIENLESLWGLVVLQVEFH